MTLKSARRLGQPPKIPLVCPGSGERGLVSVLIPTFNRGYILDRAIESVLGQSYRPVEIIVVDDGSTDETREVVARFGSAVTYIYQPNQGLAAARNAGLAAARGEFIAFQDSDDVWMPWKLAAQVALMRRVPELALVWTDMTAIDPSGTVMRNRHLRTMYSVYGTIEIERWLPIVGRARDLVPEFSADLDDCEYRYGDIFDTMFYGNLVHPPTVLLRRECVSAAGGLDLSYAWSCEDYEFLWRASQHGLAALIDAPGMLYRVDAPDQLTNPERMLAKARGNVIVHERRLQSGSRPIRLSRRAIRQQLADAYSWLAFEELLSGNGNRWRSLHFFLKSLWFNPLQKKTLVYFFLDVFLPGPLFNLMRGLKQEFTDTFDIYLS